MTIMVARTEVEKIEEEARATTTMLLTTNVTTTISKETLERSNNIKTSTTPSRMESNKESITNPPERSIMTLTLLRKPIKLTPSLLMPETSLLWFPRPKGKNPRSWLNIINPSKRKPPSKKNQRVRGWLWVICWYSYTYFLFGDWQWKF